MIVDLIQHRGTFLCLQLIDQPHDPTAINLSQMMANGFLLIICMLWFLFSISWWSQVGGEHPSLSRFLSLTDDIILRNTSKLGILLKTVVVSRNTNCWFWLISVKQVIAFCMGRAHEGWSVADWLLCEKQICTRSSTKPDRQKISTFCSATTADVCLPL